jgi:hypothetical protein
LVIPGATAAATQMSIATANLLPVTTSMRDPSGSNGRAPGWIAALAAVFALPIFFTRRPRFARLGLGGLVAAALLTSAGCGARIAPETAATSQSFTITVTGTGTNLAGAVVSHSMQVKLTVQ